MGEAYFSAQQPQPQGQARVPRSDEHPRRSGDHQGAPRPRTLQAVGLGIDSIRDQRSFSRLRSSGRRLSAGDLWVIAVIDEASPAPRSAFAIGRSVGNAVLRNRLRRRLRVLLDRVQAPPGLYLVGARPGAAQRSFPELAQMLSTIFSRIERLPARAERGAP
jgi:ribonuclease P protein component